jgi:hypothetical protein
VTEALLSQHLESPSRTGRGRVPDYTGNTATITRHQGGYPKLGKPHSHWAIGAVRRSDDTNGGAAPRFVVDQSYNRSTTGSQPCQTKVGRRAGSRWGYRCLSRPGHAGQ